VAEQAYRGVLDRKPRLARIWVQYGHALNEQRRFADALDAYGRANEVEPGRADTVHQIARMHERLGEYERAIERFDEAIALDPAQGDVFREGELLKAWMRSRENRLPNLPERLRFVILGTTGLCNASCIHCPTGNAETAHTPQTPMPMPLFKKIVDGIADLELPVTNQVSFGLFGDALIDPFVVKRAEYMAEKLPLARISINTNGAAYNAKRHAVLNDYAFIVALHCESLVPETFDDLMRPLRLKRVLPKYEEILKAFPGKVHVSVPVSKRNVDELPSIREWFLDRGAAHVVYDPLSSRCAEDHSLFDSLALNPVKIACPPEIMDDLVVDCDGQVLLCCQDFERLEGIGNLETESVVEVLTGLHRANTRKRLAENRHDEFATCSRCYGDCR